MIMADQQNSSLLGDSDGNPLDQQTLIGPEDDRERSLQGATKSLRGFGLSRRHSPYLRRWFLIAMALLFVVLATALEILNYFSNRDRGLAPAPGGMHYYLWRYGPALILTIVAAIWGQIEYRIQILAPWIQLSSGPLPATSNLLLNYITPWGIVSLFRSLSAGHYAVALGIGGGMILKALIIVSTGLLASKVQQLGFDAELRMVDQFNLSLNAGHYYGSSLADPGVALWAASQAGVPYRPGATPEHAALSFVPFDMEDLGPGTALSANVPVLSVDQECTTFSWTYPTDYSTKSWPLADVMPHDDFEQLSPYCLWYQGFSSWDPFPTLTNNVSSLHINKTVLVDLDCPKNVSEMAVNPIPTDRLKVFTSIGVDLPGNVSTVSALLCHPRYSVTLRRVTTSRGDAAGGDVLEISGDVLERLDLGVAPPILTYDILNSVNGYEGLVGDIGVPYWVHLMNLTTPQPDWTAFSSTTLLSTAFQRTFRTLAVLTAKYTKTTTATDEQTLPGHVMYTTPRLVVTTASLRAMEALLATLALVALLLCLYNLEALAEEFPSLMKTATVLAASDRLRGNLRAEPVPQMQMLATSLRGCSFSTASNTQTIQVQDDPDFDHGQIADAKLSLPDSENPAPRWWRPMAARKSFRISLVVTTLLSFIALEAVYQVSNQRGGFVDVSIEGYTEYLWLFLPALFMAGLSLAYGSIDTASRTLYPYTELSRGTDGNRDSIQFDPRSSISLVALAQALRRRSFGFAAIISTSILGGLLTIAASGLYSTAELAQGRKTVSLGLGSWFDIRSAYQKEEWYSGWKQIPPDALISQAIHLNNVSYPAGTYGEFAFAVPETNDLGVYSSPSNSSATLRARVPAAQAQANCSVYLFWDLMEVERDASKSFLATPPPSGCERGDTDLPSDGRFLNFGQMAGLAPTPGYFGFIAQLWWQRLPNATNADGTYTPDPRTPYTVCSDNTQHLFIVYGHRIDFTMHNVTLLHCLPFVQALEVEATFTLPALTVADDDSISPPPQPIGPATPWASTNRSHNSIPFPEIAADENESVDPFFTVLTRSARGGTPLDTLVGRDRTDAMIARVNEVYAQLGAQALHFNYRLPVANVTATTGNSASSGHDGRPPPPGAGGGRIEGVVSVPPPLGRARLVQTEVSTRLLEGLLLCLAVCGMVSFWVLRGTEKLLPTDPGSVAAQMGLLAGSELVERLRRDGLGAVEGARFGLGWWERECPEGLEGEEGEEGKGKSKWRYGIDIILPSDSVTGDGEEKSTYA